LENKKETFENMEDINGFEIDSEFKQDNLEKLKEEYIILN
jgi:hypothetical protein